MISRWETSDSWSLETVLSTPQKPYDYKQQLRPIIPNTTATTTTLHHKYEASSSYQFISCSVSSLSKSSHQYFHLASSLSGQVKEDEQESPEVKLFLPHLKFFNSDYIRFHFSIVTFTNSSPVCPCWSTSSISPSHHFLGHLSPSLTPPPLIHLTPNTKGTALSQRDDLTLTWQKKPSKKRQQNTKSKERVFFVFLSSGDSLNTAKFFMFFFFSPAVSRSFNHADGLIC